MHALLGFIGIGPVELVVVGLVILLLFGSRLPTVMRSLGRSVVEFKKGASLEDDSAEETANPYKSPKV